MRVLVLGAYGLIGMPVSEALLAGGHQVNGLGRSVARPKLQRPDISWIAADIAKLTTPESWLPLLAGVECVVNCAGALQDGARDNVRAVQLDAMVALYQACERSRIQRFVQISAAGAEAGAPTEFMRTKFLADKALMASALDWIILRPGLVLAPAAYGGTALLRALAACPLLVPVLDSQAPIQTVHVGDVADAVARAIAGNLRSRAVYDLVEAEPHQLGEIATAYRAWLGLPPARVVQVARPIARIACRIGDILGAIGWRPPMRSTALVQIEAGVVGDCTAYTVASGVTITSLGASLRRIPATVQERWFARLFLLKPLVIATLALFWLGTGLIALAQHGATGGLLAARGVAPALADLIAIVTSLVDIALGLMVLAHRSHVRALQAMLAVTLLYLAMGTWFAPELWLDPLGVYVKAVPAAVLALVALAFSDER